MSKKKIIIQLFLTLQIMAGGLNVSAQKNDPKNSPDPKVLTAKEVEVIDYYYRATTQRLLGNDNDALTLYLYCISKDPKNSGAHYQVSCLYNDLKQPSKGVDFAKEAIKLEPKNKWYLIEYADLLLQTGKIKQASKIYDQVLKIEPNNQEYQLQKADILIYLKQYSKAIDIYDKLEKKLGIVAEISLQKQKLYLAQGNYSAAEREMQILIEKYPDDPEYYGMFAEFYLSINKKEKAMQMFQKVLELDPLNPIIHLALANYYQENGQPEKAFEYIKLAFHNPEVAIDNKVKIMLSYYDLSATNATRKAEAEELLEILVEVHPEEAKAWSIKGDFLIRDNKTEEAIIAFEKVIGYQNDKYVVWERLLNLYYNKGDNAKMESQSAKAIELFPNMPVFYYFNGMANYMIGNYDAALESYTTGKDLVINAPKTKTDFYARIAEVHAAKKNFAEARANYETAMGMKVENLYLLNSYAYFLLTSENNLPKAKEINEQAQKIEKNDYTLLDVQAWIAYKSGNTEEAMNLIQISLKNGGENDARVIEHYGDLLFKQGKTTEALEQWNKAKLTKGKHSDLLNIKIQQQKLVE
jgi:tetratricopeptide (TPR) repeat protein